jgi:elongation factor G
MPGGQPPRQGGRGDDDHGYDEEEIARKHTLVRQRRLRRVEQDQDQLHRHAGLANFLSDARAALRVADAALVVVDALHGVEVSTEKGVGDRRRAVDAAASSR